jgi:hypothetical protein
VRDVPLILITSQKDFRFQFKGQGSCQGILKIFRFLCLFDLHQVPPRPLMRHFNHEREAFD